MNGIWCIEMDLCNSAPSSHLCGAEGVESKNQMKSSFHPILLWLAWEWQGFLILPATPFSNQLHWTTSDGRFGSEWAYAGIIS
jgi:hypothetical protein